MCDFGMLGDSNSKYFPAKVVATIHHRARAAVVSSFNPYLVEK